MAQSDDLDNVVSLRPDSEPLPDLVGSFDLRPDRRPCPHPQFILHEREQRVECRDCGKTLDAFWCLREMALKESMVRKHWVKLRMLVEKLAERTRYKCRSCGRMNDLRYVVKVNDKDVWNTMRDEGMPH